MEVSSPDHRERGRRRRGEVLSGEDIETFTWRHTGNQEIKSVHSPYNSNIFHTNRFLLAFLTLRSYNHPVAWTTVTLPLGAYPHCTAGDGKELPQEAGPHT